MHFILAGRVLLYFGSFLILMFFISLLFACTSIEIYMFSWLQFVACVTGNKACYLYVDGGLLELHWFKQSYGSWFLGDYVCEGKIIKIEDSADSILITDPYYYNQRNPACSLFVILSFLLTVFLGMKPSSIVF